jgi:hypothetical protein
MLSKFENKGQPAEIPAVKIVEAYGLRKCPKLVHQIAGSDLEVRQNALAVICEEFQNPFSISGCADEGAIKVLAQMVTDPDFTTRVRATKALSLAALDAKGLSAILHDDVIPLVLKGISDSADAVRGNVYQFLQAVSKSPDGVNACVISGVTQALVGALIKETDHSLKPFLLRSIYNLSSSEEGLIGAISSKAVESCIDLLRKTVENAKIGKTTKGAIAPDYSSFEPSVVIEAAKTLGFMCFDGRAKIVALNHAAIAQLIGILKLKKHWTSDIRCSITVALMAITITDNGKIQIFEENGVDNIINLLYDDSKVVILNTLKIISNIAIYPKNREILLHHPTCVAKLENLSNVADGFVSKHAKVALKAVNWTP